MPNTSITKEALADALKALLANQPLSKISIKDITNYCGISRNTFYYHFQDKYELINWIFFSDMNEHIASFADPDKLPETFVDVCKVLYAHRKFYMACFQYTGQNSLYGCMHDFYVNLWTRNLEHTYQKYQLSIKKDELYLTARMKTHALLGMLSEWVQNGMHDDYMIYFEQMRTILERETVPSRTFHKKAKIRSA